MEDRIADLERKVASLERSLANLLSVREKNNDQRVGSRLFRFTLNEDMGGTTSLVADADIIRMGGGDTGIDAAVRDPDDYFSELTNGAKGLCVLQDGLYYIIQAECPE